MATSENTWNVANRLHSNKDSDNPEVNHIIGGADEIYDDGQGRKQSEINVDVARHDSEINDPTNGLQKRVEDIEAMSQIGDTPVETNAGNIISDTSLSGKVASASAVNGVYNALDAQTGYYTCGTAEGEAAKTVDAPGFVLSRGGSIKIKMTNANSANNATLNINSTGEKPLFYDGDRASATNSWEEGETVEVYYDGTSYYANNVAGGSGSGDGAFDVSAKYPTSGVGGGNTYTLAGALDVLNRNLSAGKKKGGMSMKFIQSSDNKYVCFRLMATTFSTNETDWQGVNTEPLKESRNLIESGAVEKYLAKDVNYITSPETEEKSISENGVESSSETNVLVRPITLNPGHTIIINPNVQTYILSDCPLLFQCDSSGEWTGNLITRATAGGYYVTNAFYTNTSDSIIYVGICTRTAQAKYAISELKVAASKEYVNTSLEKTVFVNKAQTFNSTEKAQGLANLGISGIDTALVAGSEKLITSGAVEAVQFHQFATKEFTTTSSGQTIILRVFDYGSNVAVRIISNTADFGSGRIYIQCRQTVGSAKDAYLNSSWTVLKADEGATIDRIYIQNQSVLISTGTIVVEIIFKDAFDTIIRDSRPEVLSDLSVESKGLFSYAQSAFTHHPGKNLCNPKDPAFKTGIYLYNGNENSNQSYGATGYIPVSQSGLVINHPADTLGYEVYDSNYRYIRTVKNTGGVYTYVSGDSFVRFVFTIAYKDSIQVEEGTISTTYDEYNPVYGQVNESKQEVKNWADARFVQPPVKPEDISFLHRYNLFDKETGQNFESGVTTVDIDDNLWGCYLYNNNLSGNVSYGVTAYLPIKGNQFFANKLNSLYKIKWICYYKEDKFYLSTETPTSKQTVFTPPENAYYARLTFYLVDKDGLMVTFDTTPTEYVSYNKFTVDDIFIEEEEEEPKPEIVMPSKVYALLGEQNSIYHNEYINCYNPYTHYLQKGGGSGWNYLESCWRRESDASAGTTLKFTLKNRLTSEIVQDVNVAMQTAAKTAGSSSIKVSCIGDSFCYGGYYLKQITDVCDNLSMVGMRLSANTNVPCEGRGGWTLSQYMNPKSVDITLSHMQPFSPFMHAEGYNYYGVIEFWASIVNSTSQYAYGTDGFSAYSSWFDTNGRKANPSENDLVYNQTAGKFEYYNGSTWVQLATDPVFTFNYSEYLQIWQIDCPDFVVIQLGTNDFYNNDTGFDAWKTNMDIVIDSINACATAQNKTINIIICSVLTISGLSYNSYGDGYIEKSRKYWEMRKKTIEAFDTETYRITKHVFISDTGTSVDDKYGFAIEEKKPFEYYSGGSRIPYNFNGVHPSVDGYKQFGTCIAGAIQCLRL